MTDYDYGDHTPKAPHQAVLELSELIDEAGNLARGIAIKKRELDENERDYRDLTEKLIPNKMKMCGLKELTTDLGYTVTIKEDLFASIPSPTTINDERDPVKRQRLIERRLECFKWLEENGHDSIVNHEVRVKLGKGQADVSDKLIERLRDEEGLHVDETVEVHHKTLQALFRRLRSEKKDIPIETFGVFDKAVAKVSKK